MNEINWIIHFVANCECDECGDSESGFLPYACNAHTHGMEEYNHQDFQMVLRLPPEEIGRILNTFGLRVKSGEKFKDGDMVSGIYEDCDVRLQEFDETGRKVLRVIIPDADNIFPEDENCNEIYKLQLLHTDALHATQNNTLN